MISPDAPGPAPSDDFPTCLADITTPEERAEMGLTEQEEQELFGRLMLDLIGQMCADHALKEQRTKRRKAEKSG